MKSDESTKNAWRSPRASNGPVLQAILLAAIFLIALGVSLYPIIHSPVTIKHGFGPYGDSYLYLVLADNLYEGHGFSGIDDDRAFGLPHPDNPPVYEPAFIRGPVYPLFICAVYKIFGSRAAMASINTWHVNWDRVRIAQCVLHAVTSLLVFWIVRLIWTASFWPALTAALIHAFCFYNVFYTSALLSESLTTFVLSGFVLLGILALKTNKVLWWLLVGMVFGVTVLLRPEYIPFAFVFGGYTLWVNRGRGRIGIRNVSLFVGAAIGTVAPWTIRNYHVSHHTVLVSGGGAGYSLYLGTFESRENWQGWGNLPDQVFYLPGERERFDTLYAQYFDNVSLGNLKVRELDAAFMQLALERIKARPWECLGRWLAKAPRLWHQGSIPVYQEEEASGNWFIFYFVFAGLSFGLATKEERVLLGLVALLFVYLNVIFLPLHIEPRYSAALMPGIIALTGIGLGKTWVWIRTKLSDRPRPPLHAK